MTCEYITIIGGAVGNPEDGYRIAHRWDRRRFLTKEYAVKNGFALADSDDFNVGVVINDKLASLWWMDDQIDEPAETLAEIAKEIGL